MRIFLMSTLLCTFMIGCGGGDNAKTDTATTDDGGDESGGGSDDGSTEGGEDAGTTEGGDETGGDEGSDGNDDSSDTSAADTSAPDTSEPDTGDTTEDPSTDAPGGGGTGDDEPETLDLSFSGELWSCRPMFDGGSPGAEGDPVYVPNRDNLCMITSEVNWKIMKGLIPGGDSAVALRDCIATALESVESGIEIETDTGTEKEMCVEEDGVRDNDTCWDALVAAEVECGGPEIEVDRGGGEGAEPGDPATGLGTVSKSVDGDGGGSGLLFLKRSDVEMGHIVTAESSPDPGPEGEWKIRDSVEGCENVVLTIEMERSPSEGGESAGGESESGTSDPVVVTPEPTDDGGEDDDAVEADDEVCITSCSAPDTFEWCCEEYETNKWCHKKFRKLKPKTPPSGGETDDPIVGDVSTPGGA